MSTKDRRPLIGMLVLVALALQAVPDPTQADHFPLYPHETVIQPGADLHNGGTLAFLFESLTQTNPDGKPALYAATHGHGDVTPDEGEEFWLWNGPLVGTVVAKKDNFPDDWALVRIAEESLQYVDFSVRHWTGPTGIPTPGSIKQGDLACNYGHGQIYNQLEETRPRCGPIARAWYSENGIGQLALDPHLTYAGDSGSPIIHYETGQALGIVLGTLFGFTHGTDVCTLMQRFADHGHPMRLATAPHDPPPPSPASPIPGATASTLETACLTGEWELEWQHLELEVPVVPIRVQAGQSAIHEVEIRNVGTKGVVAELEASTNGTSSVRFQQDSLLVPGETTKSIALIVDVGSGARAGTENVTLTARASDTKSAAAIVQLMIDDAGGPVDASEPGRDDDAEAESVEDDHVGGLDAIPDGSGGEVESAPLGPVPFLLLVAALLLVVAVARRGRTGPPGSS